MNKKRLGATIASLALVGVIGLGATLAYFTDNDKETNVITMGHVDIDLTEPNYEGDADNKIDNVVPGRLIAKDPTVTLQEGSQDAYIRVKVDYKLDGETMSDDLVNDLVKGMDIDYTKWFKGTDGYYYYNTKLTADNNTTTLFNEVKIPGKWKNWVANKTLTIDVTAEAIQADNFTPTESDGLITGWVDEAGAPITAETYNG